MTVDELAGVLAEMSAAGHGASRLVVRVRDDESTELDAWDERDLDLAAVDSRRPGLAFLLA